MKATRKTATTVDIDLNTLSLILPKRVDPGVVGAYFDRATRRAVASQVSGSEINTGPCRVRGVAGARGVGWEGGGGEGGSSIMLPKMSSLTERGFLFLGYEFAQGTEANRYHQRGSFLTYEEAFTG